LPGTGFQIAAAYKFADSHGLAAEAESIRRMPVHASINRAFAVRKGALIELLEARGLMPEFVDLHWSNRHATGGEKRRAYLLQRLRLNERRLRDGHVDVTAPGPNGGEGGGEVRPVALEAHLRDFIASNLSRIPLSNATLRLYWPGTWAGSSWDSPVRRR
jgi:hypothetical protein